MKVILTLDLPDEEILKQGIDAQRIREEFEEMEEDLKETLPGGATVKLTIE